MRELKYRASGLSDRTSEDVEIYTRIMMSIKLPPDHSMPDSP